MTHNIFQGLKITSVSSGDRFNVVLAEPTSPRTASDPSRSTPVASPKKCESVPSRRDGKRISCPLGLPLESGKGGKKSDQDDDVELRKSKGAISSLTVIHFSSERSKFRIRYPVWHFVSRQVVLCKVLYARGNVG